MKKEDQLTDALLKEHARGGAGADEAFLKELEERLDAKEKVLPMPTRSTAGSRWALGTGVAACLALGFGVTYLVEDVETVSEAPDLLSYFENSENARDQAMNRWASEYQRQPSPAAPTSPNASVMKGKEVEGRAREDLYRAEGYANLGQYDKAEAEYKKVLGKDRYDQSARRGLEKIEATKTAYHRAAYDQTRAVLLSEVDNAWELAVGEENKQPQGAPSQLNERRIVIKGQLSSAEEKVDSVSRLRTQRDAIVAIPPAEAPANTERYGQLVENKFTAPIDERSALSTFAVDVDTASYTNVRRMINEGQVIPKDSVRIEEMVNYFDYAYAQPKGEHPFAVQVDAAVCPWNAKHRIVRIGVQGKEIIREQRPATNLVFLLDVSGSMSSANKLPLLKQSMNYLLEELNEKDTVSIVVYAGASGLALPATKVDDAGRQLIAQTMDKLSAGGSTAGGQGIKLAYKVAKENFKSEGINRIILATDGDFNVGVSDNAELTKMVKEKAKAGTYLSVLGFGSGNINDAMLESITNNGNGNYSYIDSIKEGRKVLLEDMMGTMVTIAKDVKVQVVMNPNKVKAYRLIGYSNRMLPPEAFLDKKVDAGEIGAGHTVTALYEIIPADGTPFDQKLDASRYFKKPEAKPNPAVKDSDEMLFVKLAYKQPEQKVEDESTYFSVPFVENGDSEASADLKFAASVGLFGMVLRESENKGSGDLKMVLKLAEENKGADGKGQRAEFIKLVQKVSEKE